MLSNVSVFMKRYTSQPNASSIPDIDPVGDGNREVTRIEEDKRNHE